MVAAPHSTSRLTWITRFVADVMNGTPSIVVGVFAWTWIVAKQHHFSAFAGSDLERLPTPLAAAARYLREHYDMRDHTRTGVAHTAGIGDDFVEWFAIAGPPDVARERLQQLATLGLDFCHVIPGSTGMPREVAVSSVRRLAQEVLPALRG